ncbi:hypothetical protein ACTOB_007078 [Actinoplanes oblitus]|uniref:Serine protease n=1 Tax=Actinoplanes oblitus TaxID=3040509 RepID=A0ABY8WC07_9ACTN|nr:hypothetical protein [Actinoplanes oblitus]WIM95017.1 hypothetical protein ACTOB_007078 [Actinoplanes oblitus]
MFHTLRRKSLALGVVVTTGATLLAFTGSPALADNGKPKAPPASQPDLIDSQDPNGQQNRLTDLKTWIIQQPGLVHSGYIESVNDAETLSTTLLWHGPADDTQRDIVAEARRRGISVKVEQRRYSRDQLVNAVQTLAKRGKNAYKNFDLNSISGITAEFDGIKVQGVPAGGSARTLAAGSGEQTPQATISEVAREASDDLGVAVSVDLGGGDTTFAATRDKDTPAYNAGGVMYSPATREICSTGFSVNVGGTRYTTTARHCTAHDYRPLNNSSNNYGDGVRNSTDGAARQMSAKGSPLMFDGSRNDANGYKKTVVGYGDVSLRDRVCTSGGNSGVHCGIRITQMVHWFDDGYSHVSNSTFATIVGDQETQKTAACQGDSGGPVLVTAGDMKVKAVGMIQGGPADDSRYHTSSATWSGGAICTWRFYFTAMRTIVNTLPNASLVTG